MKTILVVEDESIICEVLVELLTQENYRILTARNGREGIDLLAQQIPDLIICDVMMPVLDGRVFCSVVKADVRFQSIPIIMMSAGVSLDRNECNYAAFIEKPFDLDVLLDMVSVAISG